MTTRPDKDFDALGIPSIECHEQATLQAMFGYGRGVVTVCRRHAERRVAHAQQRARNDAPGASPDSRIINA
ncbi:hypothetical protein BTO20_19695 [Mycobacterium dioxanotrophicus]|uniref:Uncharacterized protein n=1 Tax=Mycobacterium dioxanotrophicus TaxID=482462 RepID=A0A1Y0C610_9MYCO|nr:hypothetical protein [Mycobacterium dioxanotrophicus]ART70495.1 hypothetical protein BTO20_19695 [Mycobacterium dioxanotrophicus]